MLCIKLGWAWSCSFSKEILYCSLFFFFKYITNNSFQDFRRITQSLFSLYICLFWGFFFKIWIAAAAVNPDDNENNKDDDDEGHRKMARKAYSSGELDVKGFSKFYIDNKNKSQIQVLSCCWRRSLNIKTTL